MINIFARAGHAPQMGMRLDPKMFRIIPPQVRSGMLMLPPVKRIRNTVLTDLGIPDSVLTYVNYPTSFDNRNAAEALEGSGIAVPPSRPTRTSSGTTGSGTSIRTCSRTARSRARSRTRS